MVTDIHFRRVTALPARCEPNTIYIVKGDGALFGNLYVTGNDRVPIPVFALQAAPDPGTPSGMDVSLIWSTMQ